MSATVGKNRRRERRFAESLVSLLGGDPPWRVVEQGEVPDFLLQRGDYRVGLEVTEIFRSDGPRSAGSKHRAAEVLRKEVMSRTAREWFERNLPPVRARVSFTGGQDFTKQDVARVVESMVRIAEERLPPLGGEATFAYHPQCLPTFPREVGRLTVRRDKDLMSTEWLPSWADWIEQLPSATLQDAIEDKEKKRECYEARIPVVWLLLAVDGFLISGTFNEIDLATHHVYRSGFSRVFLLDRSASRVWRLRLSEKLGFTHGNPV